MASIKSYDVDFENYPKSELDTYAEGYDDNLVELFTNNINSMYKLEETEVEIRSFQNIKEYGGVSNTLNKFQFDQLLDFFEEHDKFTKLNIFEQEKNTLDISVHSSNYVDPRDDLSNLRFTINGKIHIKTFCMKNIIPKNCKVIYKGRYNWNPELNENITELNQDYKFKKSPDTGLKTSRGTVDLYSTRNRLGGKLEIPYVNKRTRKSADITEKNKLSSNNVFIASNIENPLLQDTVDKATNTMRKYSDLLKKSNGSKNLFKTFRLKDRTGFMFLDSTGKKNIRIDLTKVKSSKKDIDQNYQLKSIPVKTFFESEIIEQNENYEFEIELINIQTMSKEELIRNINIGINISKFCNKLINERDDGFTHTNIKDDVLFVYKELIKNVLTNRIDQNLRELNNAKLYRQLKEKLSQDGEDTESKQAKLAMESQYTQYSYFNRFSDNTKNIDSEKLKLEEIKNSLTSLTGKFRNNNFLKISPKVVSISMDHVRDENPDAITRNYSVTDKADGLANILFKIDINHLDETLREKYLYLKNYIFFIDSNLNVFNTMRKTDDILGSMVLNGEYLNYNKEGDYINKYGVYDTYIYNDRDVCLLPLISRDDKSESRIKLGQNYLNRDVSLDLNPLDLSLFHKEFLIPDVGHTIFSCTNTIWTNYNNGKTEYKLDGTIYTPIDEPVGWNSDRLDYYLNQGVTWFRNLKWKPSHDNTIDFLLRFEKEEVSRLRDQIIYKNKTKTIRSDTGSYDKYIIGNLFNTGSEKVGYNPCSSNKKTYFGKTKPIPFNPPKPKISNINFGLFKIETAYEGDPILDLEGTKVENDTVVEVSYTNFDPSKDSYEPNQNKRFSILRTRHDKTYTHRIAVNRQKEIFKIIQKCIKIAETSDNNRTAIDFLYKNRYLFSKYDMCGNLKNIRKDELIDKISHNILKIKKYYKTYSDVTQGINLNYGNSVDVANNIWMSIYNPVTPEIIKTGMSIPDIADEEKKYYNRKDNQKRDKSITLGLQNFHNKIIKKRILLANVVNLLKQKGESEISLLDLACGKGGDIAKWKDLGIKNCVGIDISYNNIIDPIDGACERYNFYKNKKLANLPDIKFLVGDVSKKMHIDSFSIPEYASVYNNLWNSEDGPKYNKNKFNIISLMFCLHYFFKDKQSLDNLVENINNNIKTNGFLIGACFDGAKIFEFLKELKVNEEKGALKGGKTIWKIIKRYSDTQFNNDDTSLGNTIKVYMYSIGQYLDEYLVNFEYFKQELAKHNINLLEVDDMNSMMLPVSKGSKISSGSFGDIFNSLNKFSQNTSYRTQFEINTRFYNDITKNLSDAEKTISFFSRYFIFKKLSSESLESQIKRHIMENSTVRGYKTYYNQRNWDKLKNRVFENLQLTKSNSLHDNAYSRATESINKELGPKKVKNIKINEKKSTLAEVVSVEKSKPESGETVDSQVASTKSKKPKFIIKGKQKKSTKSAVNVSEKIKGHRTKIKKVITMVTKKISNKQTTGLKQKISLLIDAFDKPPQNNDPEISAGINRLKQIKEEL